MDSQSRSPDDGKTAAVNTKRSNSVKLTTVYLLLRCVISQRKGVLRWRYFLSNLLILNALEVDFWVYVSTYLRRQSTCLGCVPIELSQLCHSFSFRTD